MGIRNVVISTSELDSTVEALASAQAFRLTHCERIAYRTLMISVDVAIVSFIVAFCIPFFADVAPSKFVYVLISSFPTFVPITSNWWAFLFALAMLALSIVVGLVSLAFNMRLFRKIFRENARLKQLGLSSLSRSLWKESRRSRWISGVRSALLMLIGLCIMLVAVWWMLLSVTIYPLIWGKIMLFSVLGFLAIIVAVLFGGRYLRNQRERMELADSAEELKQALENLRRRGDNDVLSVPARMLEQGARIETAKIGERRKDAVLESAAFRPRAYAVAFDRGALQERASLGDADRVELEELVAQVSTEGEQLAAQASPAAKDGRPQGTIKGGRVEFDYVIDRARRGIHINDVRQRGDGVLAAVNGAGNA